MEPGSDPQVLVRRHGAGSDFLLPKKDGKKARELRSHMEGSRSPGVQLCTHSEARVFGLLPGAHAASGPALYRRPEANVGQSAYCSLLPVGPTTLLLQTPLHQRVLYRKRGCSGAGAARACSDGWLLTL